MAEQSSLESSPLLPVLGGRGSIYGPRVSYGVIQPQPSTSSEDHDVIIQDDQYEPLTQSMEEKLDHHPVESLVLDANYESLDYDTCENDLYVQEEQCHNKMHVRKVDFLRWVVMFMIGVLTALIAFSIDVAIQLLSSFKYSLVKSSIDRCMLFGCMYTPFVIWVGFDAGFVFFAAFLTAVFEPVAAGSGIPQIKCYLNGVLVPRVVRIKTLIIKVTGVILSVAGGLAIGKEGPMIHSGSVVAAGISQGRTSTLNLDANILKFFRTDQEKRDFVASGAAAGVAAAFGAPVGGVLFSLEEGASYWNQGQTWRTFFASTISFFTLNIFMSLYKHRPFELSYSGLLNFGKFENLEYEYWELLIFVLMGVVGGLLGAGFNGVNKYLTIHRKRYVTRPAKQVLEATIVAISTTTVAMLCSYYVVDCQPLGKDPTEFPLQMFCPDGQASSMAAIWMQTPEQSVKSLFHDQSGTYNTVTLLIFSLFYFFLATWTYGLTIPSGLFIPSLLTGAAWGRLIGQMGQWAFPEMTWIDPGKYALVGAAAQLGGVVRMTLSLTVILIEATGNISFGLPLMLVLMTAKMVGDVINHGLYDIHIEMSSVPILSWEPPAMSTKIQAREVMSHPVTTFSQVEKVGRIVDILKQEKHQGFPVVDHHPVTSLNPCDQEQTFGILSGLVTRAQLIVLLENKEFTMQDVCERRKTLNFNDFRRTYPRYTDIDKIEVSEYQRECTMDLSAFMNPAPYAVSDKTSLPRIFKLFRGLGLRHLVVINKHNEVSGIVTRKDLARYKLGVVGVEEIMGYVRK